MSSGNMYWVRCGDYKSGCESKSQLMQDLANQGIKKVDEVRAGIHWETSRPACDLESFNEDLATLEPEPTYDDYDDTAAEKKGYY